MNNTITTTSPYTQDSFQASTWLNICFQLTALWEYFSYYGMRALFVLLYDKSYFYSLTKKHLEYTEHLEHWCMLHLSLAHGSRKNF